MTSQEKSKMIIKLTERLDIRSALLIASTGYYFEIGDIDIYRDDVCYGESVLTVIIETDNAVLTVPIQQ